jgi:hypothetical protein
MYGVRIMVEIQALGFKISTRHIVHVVQDLQRSERKKDADEYLRGLFQLHVPDNEPRQNSARHISCNRRCC